MVAKAILAKGLASDAIKMAQRVYQVCVEHDGLLKLLPVSLFLNHAKASSFQDRETLRLHEKSATLKAAEDAMNTRLCVRIEQVETAYVMGEGEVLDFEERDAAIRSLEADFAWHLRAFEE